GDVDVAERFELYLGPLELANGYHELTDAAEQQARFERERAVRAGRGLVQPPIDQALLGALAAGMPDCAGVALGIDRMLMAMLGTGAIADVLAYDFDRSEEHTSELQSRENLVCRLLPEKKKISA